MATTISKTQTQKGEIIVNYNAGNASNICDDDTSTYQSSSLTGTIRIGIGNFNFSIPSEATISKVSFSTLADSTKGNAYIDRYVCTNLTSSNTSDPPTPQLVKTRLFGTSTTISEPQNFSNEYTSSEFQSLITSAGLSTGIIDFLNNDVDVYFVCSKSAFKSTLIHIYDNKITVDYTVPAYNISVSTAGGVLYLVVVHTKVAQLLQSLLHLTQAIVLLSGRTEIQTQLEQLRQQRILHIPHILKLTK